MGSWLSSVGATPIPDARTAHRRPILIRLRRS